MLTRVCAAMSAARPCVWETVWCGSVTSMFGYVRTLNSRQSMKVKTRV